MQNEVHHQILLFLDRFEPYQGAPPGGMGDMPGGASHGKKAKSKDQEEEDQYRKATGQDDNVVDADYK